MKEYDDLILGAGSGSDGSGPSRLQRRRGSPGDSSPRRRVGKNSPELWNPAFQGWIGSVLWPVSMDGARVIYLDAQIGGLGFDWGSPG